jgi:hypothetical protein
MSARHGTRRGYGEGCRCDDCKDAQRRYQRRYRERRANATSRDPHLTQFESPERGPGPVESGVEAELAGLADARPGLAQTALALARIMDNPMAVNQQPAAAKVLAILLDKLSSASVRGRRGNLAVVRTMTQKNGG